MIVFSSKIQLTYPRKRTKGGFKSALNLTVSLKTAAGRLASVEYRPRSPLACLTAASGELFSFPLAAPPALKTGPCKSTAELLAEPAFFLFFCQLAMVFLGYQVGLRVKECAWEGLAGNLGITPFSVT